MSQLGKHSREETEQFVKPTAPKRARIIQIIPLEQKIHDPVIINNLSETKAISQSATSPTEQSAQAATSPIASTTQATSPTAQPTELTTSPTAQPIELTTSSTSQSNDMASKSAQLNNATNENKQFVIPTFYVDADCVTMHYCSDCEIRNMNKTIRVSRSIVSMVSSAFEQIFKNKNVHHIICTPEEWKNLHMMLLAINVYLKGSRYIGVLNLNTFIKYEIRPYIIKNMIVQLLYYYNTFNIEQGYGPLSKGSAHLREMLCNISSNQYNNIMGIQFRNYALTEAHAYQYYAKYICKFIEYAHGISNRDYIEIKHIIITFLKKLVIHLEIAGLSRVVMNHISNHLPNQYRSLVFECWFGASF